VLCAATLPQPSGSQSNVFLGTRVYKSSAAVSTPSVETHRRDGAVARLWQGIAIDNALPSSDDIAQIGADSTSGSTDKRLTTSLSPLLTAARDQARHSLGLAGPWSSGGVDSTCRNTIGPATFMPVRDMRSAYTRIAPSPLVSDHDPIQAHEGNATASACIRIKPLSSESAPLQPHARISRHFLWWGSRRHTRA